MTLLFWGIPKIQVRVCSERWCVVYAPMRSAELDYAYLLLLAVLQIFHSEDNPFRSPHPAIILIYLHSSHLYDV